MDELETATVLPEFVFATEVLLPLLSALFVSEDFVLLERTGTAFTDEPVAGEALLADPIDGFVLGLAGECATFGAASGCFEFSAAVEDATEFFNSLDAGMVVAPEAETPGRFTSGNRPSYHGGFRQIDARTICNRLRIYAGNAVRGILCACRSDNRLQLFLSWLRFSSARIIFVRI